MTESILIVIIIILFFWYHIRLLSDKTDYEKIREIIEEELEKGKSKRSDD